MKKGQATQTDRKLKIYLFRHGQTTYNRDKIFTGFKDAKLTFLGKKQAGIIAKKLKTKKFQAAFHTRLSRSIDTSNIVLKNHPECILLVDDDRMIERSYGKLEGKSHDSIINKYGQDKFNLWHRGFNTRPPGGESFKDVEKRVKSFIVDLKKFMKKNNVSVAISAHGNSMRVFRKYFEKLSNQEMCSLYNDYESVYEYDVEV